MDIYKPLYTRVVKPLWLMYKKENHTKHWFHLQQFHKKSIEEIRAYQLKKLQDIVSTAYQFVPFYRREWDSVGLKPQDIRGLEDIKAIPILTKDKLRSCNEEFISEKANREELIVSRTGGTTAVPIQLLYGKDRLLYKTAEMDFFRRWWGWDFGDKVAYLWGASRDIPYLDSIKYKVYNALFGRNLFLFASLLDDRIMKEYTDKILKFRPAIIQAYTNSAYLMARFMVKNNIKIDPPKAVILTAELIHDYQREAVEKAFRAPVYTFYGSRETGYAGIECDAHDGYHVNCSSLLMEIVHNNADVQPGELGSILFTDLLNTDMPLIRYKIEDMATPADGSCSCGSVLPKIKFFAGRETDVFVTPDGKYVPGVTMAGIIGVCNGIKALQFIQNAPDHMMVNIVRGASFSQKDIQRLDREIHTYFNGAVRVSKQFVDDIPKATSGKTRYCICNVPKYGENVCSEIAV
jgi:phenylacetate-CoA ligase